MAQDATLPIRVQKSYDSEISGCILGSKYETELYYGRATHAVTENLGDHGAPVVMSLLNRLACKTLGAAKRLVGEWVLQVTTLAQA